MAWSAEQKRIESKKKNVDSMTRFSVWTPMTHGPTNEKVYEERREVVQKWVCWFWKYLTELDQLWMPKALKLGWYMPFTPHPFEAGVWKRHYLENVRSLHYLPQKNAKGKGRPLSQTNGVESPGRADNKTPDKPPAAKKT